MIHPLAKNCEIDIDMVNVVRQDKNLPMMEAKAIVKNMKLYRTLEEMKSLPIDEKINALISLIQQSID